MRAHLCTDEKSRAENLMIVDLLRNDLARVAAVGSVRVSDLFTLETHRSLHQMTSGILARRRADAGFAAIVRALFPCGSVTGAPKIRAMEIIDEIETGRRGLLHGIAGFRRAVRRPAFQRDDPHRRDRRRRRGRRRHRRRDRRRLPRAERIRGVPAQVAVLFRSLCSDEPHRDHCLGAEPGLRPARPPPRRGSSNSAGYFAIPCDLRRGAAALAEAVRASRLRPACGYGCCLMRTEFPRVTASPLEESGARPWRFVLASTPTSSADRFLYHKTTRRAFYDRERHAAQRAHGVDEVVFRNERGELTEGPSPICSSRRAAGSPPRRYPAAFCRAPSAPTSSSASAIASRSGY